MGNSSLSIKLLDMPMTAFMGVRISCDMFAKKLCLEAAAASATSFAVFKSIQALQCYSMYIEMMLIKQSLLPFNKVSVLALSSSSSIVRCCRLAVRSFTKISILFAYFSSYKRLDVSKFFQQTEVEKPTTTLPVLPCYQSWILSHRNKDLALLLGSTHVPQ